MKYLWILCFYALATACTNGDSQKHSVNSQFDHSSMGHSKMKSSPGASAAPFELQFIDTMIAHHRGAIEMAKLAEGRTTNPQLQTFANGIIEAQEREIDEMTRLRMKWFGEEPAAVNMDFPGMGKGMDSMDLGKLKNLKGVKFDLEFVRQMIAHHEGAVTMANELRNSDSYAELKRMAGTIIEDQTAEIQKMKEWQAQWSNQN